MLEPITQNQFTDLLRTHNECTAGFGINRVEYPFIYYGTMTRPMLAVEHRDGVNREPKYYSVVSDAADNML